MSAANIHPRRISRIMLRGQRPLPPPGRTVFQRLPGHGSSRCARMTVGCAARVRHWRSSTMVRRVQGSTPPNPLAPIMKKPANSAGLVASPGRHPSVALPWGTIRPGEDPTRLRIGRVRSARGRPPGRAISPGRGPAASGMISRPRCGSAWVLPSPCRGRRSGRRPRAWRFPCVSCVTSTTGTASPGCGLVAASIPARCRDRAARR